MSQKKRLFDFTQKNDYSMSHEKKIIRLHTKKRLFDVEKIIRLGDNRVSEATVDGNKTAACSVTCVSEVAILLMPDGKIWKAQNC